MVKITTNTGKEYTISENTDLEVLAQKIYMEAFSNAEEEYILLYAHHKWYNELVLQLPLFKWEHPGQTLKLLLTLTQNL